MRSRRVFLALMLGLSGVLALTPAPARAQGLDLPITGGLRNSAGQLIARLTGNFNVTEFLVNEEGQLVAVGDLTGQVRTLAGNVIKNFTLEDIEIPVTDLDGAEVGDVCEVLDLTLGPIDLSLLGLILHVDVIHIDLDADPAGGLLGDLLCSLAGGLGLDLGDLLDQLPIGSLVDLLDGAGLLDDFLGILGGLLG